MVLGTFETGMGDVAKAFEAAGVVVLIIGLVVGFVRAGVDLKEGADTYRRLRSFVGRTILLGLEILVAADLIRTVAVDPSLENVGVLALIVLIRTFLSFSLDVEIDGRFHGGARDTCSDRGQTGSTTRCIEMSACGRLQECAAVRPARSLHDDPDERHHLGGRKHLPHDTTHDQFDRQPLDRPESTLEVCHRDADDRLFVGSLKSIALGSPLMSPRAAWRWFKPARVA